MGVSRQELFGKLGIARPGPKLRHITAAAFESYGKQQLNTGRFRSAFWGGMFPSGNQLHCGRHALYSLLNLPQSKPSNAKLQATSESGSAAEGIIVRRWEAAGLTLGGNFEAGEQVRLQDPEYWISSALDAVLDLRPDWNAVVPVDVKSKKNEIIEQMKFGQSEADPAHRAQVMCYIHMCRLHHEREGWAALGLEPARGGFVFYVSRDDPSNCFDYWVPWDEDEAHDALERLKEWRENFVARTLPPREKSWRWTELPCKWCDYKPLCKQDMKEDVADLAQSNTVRAAGAGYDFESTREQVLKRWEEAGER